MSNNDDIVEFRYGDRVTWKETGRYVGTVIDERNANSKPHFGDFHYCLPLPVLVVWDEPGEAWWERAQDLRLAWDPGGNEEGGR